MQVVPGEWLKLSVAAVVGAFSFVYIAVKVGTPSSMCLMVNCDSVTSDLNVLENRDREPLLREAMKKRGILSRAKFSPEDVADGTVRGPKGPPWVWPYHFEVTVGAMVCWHLLGTNGTDVKITFNQDNFDPFSFGQQSVFRGTVPGTIVAGPVVKAGRGNYMLVINPDSPNPLVHIVDGGGSQDKHS
jgi:hypothetical protein